MMKRTLALLISGLAMVFFFQNCSKAGLKVDDIGSVTPSNVDGQGNPQPTPTPPQSVTDLMNSCDDAKARGKIQVKTVQIDFNDNLGNCPWNSGDNLGMVQDSITARVEQVQQVQVPAGATVCQMTLDNVDELNFVYDDNIILTLNDYVMASTTNFSKHFASNNGYYKYDWSRLVSKKAQNSASDSAPDNQYCAGKSSGLASCLFPKTETVGRVDLQFDQRVIQNILGITSASDVKLKMITTGDNDPDSDCHHTPIRLNVQIQYF